MGLRAQHVGTALALVAGITWAVWRGFLIAGAPWPAGHACASVVSCRDGLCLVHARGAAGLTTTAGYCSRRCATTADCPSGMRCEPLPSGISRANGDHLPLVQLPERLCVRTVEPAAPAPPAP